MPWRDRNPWPRSRICTPTVETWGPTLRAGRREPRAEADVLESRDRNAETKQDDYFDRLDAAFAELGSELDRDSAREVTCVTTTMGAMSDTGGLARRVVWHLAGRAPIAGTANVR